MSIDLAVVNGTCVTAERTVEADVAVEDGTIVALGDADRFPDAERIVDASGLLVMPGFVDPHVHIDDASSIDTYATATGAAAVGGITTVIDFAWQTEDNDPANEPRPLMEGIRQKREKAETSGAYVDHALHGGLTVEDPGALEELETAVEAGVTSFKMFTAYDFRVSNGFIRRALERIADLGAVGVFHTEDNEVCESRTAEYRAAGHSDPTWYPRSRPDYAEAMAAEDVLRLVKETGAKYYGVHTSCRKTAAAIDGFLNDGSQIRTETCTHYIALDDAIYEEQGTLPLIAPPIRTEDDIEALFEQLRSGTLSVVSTDHSPHYTEEKRVEWWNSPYGAGSLRVSVPVFHDVAVNERGLSYPFLVAVMSRNPARTFGLPNKGTLHPGTDADLVLFDPYERYTITADDSPSKQDFTIYDGREVTGCVTKTFLRGQLVANDGELVTDRPRGAFLEREVPDWER